jgi:hypothetical protein
MKTIGHTSRHLIGHLHSLSTEVHLAPAGEDWRAARNAAGLDELVARLASLTLGGLELLIACNAILRSQEPWQNA